LWVNAYLKIWVKTLDLGRNKKRRAIFVRPVPRGLLEPFSLFYRFYRDFLLLATAIANALFLDVPKPFHILVIGIRAECFKNDQLTIAIFAS
jgi:hypothetical protein